MLVVLDTNVLISALLGASSLPAHLVDLWREGRFALATSSVQLDELARVTRYPKVRARLAPALAGRLVNDIRQLALMVERLPSVDVCADPNDNHLLATTQACGADFLVTGDKRDLLALGAHAGTRIVTVRAFLTLHRRLP